MATTTTTTTTNSKSPHSHANGDSCKCANHLLWHIDCVPQWQRSNEHIRGGYRVNYSFFQIFKSVFYLHNETVNIWTHLMGAVFTLMVLFGSVVLLSPYGVDWLHTQSAHLNTLCPMEVKSIQEMPQCVNPWFVWDQQHFTTHTDTELQQLRHHVQGYAITRERLLCILSVVKDQVRSLVTSRRHDVERAIDGLLSDGAHQKLLVLRQWLVDEVHLHDLMDSVQHHLHLLNVFSVHRPDVGLIFFLPTWPIGVFLVSAALCLSMSAVYHWFLAFSWRTFKVLQRADYAGISLLISGSAMPVFYYGFLCHPTLSLVYTVTLCVAGFVVFLVSVLPQFSKPHLLSLRAGMFVSLGVFAGLPIIHLMMMESRLTTIIQLEVLMGAIYIGGAICYAVKFPECCCPGTFDMYCSSHNIFHVCVLGGVAVHYYCVKALYEWRITAPCM